MVRQYTGWHFTASATKGRDGWPLRKVEEMPKGTRPVLCEVGLHASREALDALGYAPGPFVSRVRLEGVVVVGDDKACATRRVRLAGPVDVSRELRLFACDCAERVLPMFERHHPGDDRPRRAIETARRFANGQATREELDYAGAAARAAARDVDEYAAREAAWDAGEYAAMAAGEYAATAAAREAATATATATARAPARDVDEYAAREAAWDAARAAAWYAGQKAAGDTERIWQEQRLSTIIRAVLPPEEQG